MADPPQFDPNAPSEVIDGTPQFDPNAPSESMEQLPTPTWSQVPGMALQNAPKSFANLATSMAQPFIDPVGTAKNLGNLALGIHEKLFKYGANPIAPGIVTLGGEHEKYADAIGRMLVARYGSEENLRRTLAEDPIGVAADVAAILSGGEGLAARAPGILGQVGRAAGTVSRAIDPVSASLKVAKGVSQATGLTEMGPAQQALNKANVLMTPGQRAGGYFKNVEDVASSIPILGAFIKRGRQNSVESFNKAVANQVLEPIGANVDRNVKAGHDLYDHVEGKLDFAYDNIKPRLTFIPDRPFHTDLLNIIDHDVAILPENIQRQFSNIMQTRVGNHAFIGMNGEMFKQVDSELSAMSRNYRNASDPAQRDLGRALDSVRTAMRQALERHNPTYAPQLKSIDTSWAMLARMRGAASRRATSEGIFTPNDLLQSIKSQDRSVGKGSFARGDALMQKFAEAGQHVLPSTVPNSGTPERLLHADLLYKAALAAIGAEVGRHFGATSDLVLNHPEAVAALAPTVLPYTKTGMKAAAQVAPKLPWRALRNTAFQAGRADQVLEQTPDGPYYRPKLPGE